MDGKRDVWAGVPIAILLLSPGSLYNIGIFLFTLRWMDAYACTGVLDVNGASFKEILLWGGVYY